MRTLAVGALLLATALPGAAFAKEPDHLKRSWNVVPKDEAELPPGSSFRALTSNGHALLLAGETYTDSSAQAEIWRSEDGLRWEATTHPSWPGVVNALAVDGRTALAVGGTGFDDPLTFVWQSNDGGLTWKEVAKGPGLFGEPAPSMGRPFVDGLLRHDGWWVAFGGRSDGYAAVWISRDGTAWREVLGANAAGGASVVKVRDGSLLAYWTNTAWFAESATTWSDPITVSAPRHFYVNSVATGARVAVADDFRKHGQPTPLLRSSDGGYTWKVDRRFLRQFPDAVAWDVARVAGLWIAAGSSRDHVDAWFSTNLHKWSALPSELYGGKGGTLSLVAAVGGRVVVMGTAPELDRYYVLD